MRKTNHVLLAGVILLAVVASAQTKRTQADPVRFVNAPDLAQPAGYSHAAVLSGGKIIFISGQIGLTRSGEMVGTTHFRAQAAQAFANLQTVLAAAGARPQNIVKLNYYVVGLYKERLQILRSIRDSVNDKKTSAGKQLPGVQALFRDDCLIEIEAEAVIP